MSETPMRERTVLCADTRAQNVEVRRGTPFTDANGEFLALDLYLPRTGDSDARFPVVIFAHGFADPGYERALGCSYKDMASTRAWATLIAAAGVAVIAYTNRDPGADLDAVLRSVTTRADEWRVDATRIGVWACSGHVPTAVSLLRRDRSPKLACAALLYGYMPDLHGATHTKDARAQWRFANPSDGMSVADIDTDVPLLVVRAGQDEMPGLNASLDAFAAAALAANLPLRLFNHPTAPHAFDLLMDDATTRGIVATTIAFLSDHLRDARAHVA